jgi:glycosyltransferase involved in cell wall biosynthesis
VTGGPTAAGVPPRSPPAAPLRILVLVARDSAHPLAAGGDRHMGQLARELAENGHTVELWTASHPRLARTEMWRGVRVLRLAPPRLLAPAVWARLLRGRARGFDVVLEEVIGGERAPFLGWLLVRPRCIGMWYQDNRPLFQATYPGGLARAAGGVQSMLLRAYRGRRLLTPSEATRSWLISTGMPPDRVCVHQPAVQLPEGVEVRRPFSLRRNRFVSIGKYRRLKRFEEAVEVLETLSSQLADAELVLVGLREDDLYVAALRERIAASPARDRVRLVLDAPDADKYAILADAKALTIHSPIEGFAWTVPEAGLCGVPTVANEGTPADTVVEGVNGVRLKIGDTGAYARTLARWMRDEAEWERLSEGARREADRHVSSRLPAAVDEFVRGARGTAG